MKIDNIKNLEIQTLGNIDDGVKAGIDQSSLPFLFELVSKSLYSDPIGSMIREIASNGWDAHKNAGIDDPVVISKSYEESQYYIEFKDKGFGMSDRDLIDIYMNYFSSTKRGDNEQIGGFGIGSKTPLAYADLFYITSIRDGIKYDCILHKGEDKPQLESLYGWREEKIQIVDEKGITSTEKKKYPLGIETYEHSGVMIKVPLLRTDLEDFKEKLEDQLTYFDNIYVNNWHFKNDYDIYVGTYFKFRSDISQSYEGLHLCIGNVKYPINFDLVKVLPSHKKAPIAVKFDIGEIQVTPSREAIRYTPATIELIKTRVELAINEIKDRFKAQNPIIDDLAEYVRLSNDKPRLVFDKDKNHVLWAWANSGLDKSYKFGPLSDIGINQIPSNIFFMFEHYATINNGKFTKLSYPNTLSNDFILREKFIVAERHERTSIYTDFKISEHFNNSTIYVIRKKELNFKHNYKDIIKNLGITGKMLESKSKIILDYIKVATKEMEKRSLGKYQDFRADDVWIADFKRRKKEESAAYLRKINCKIFVRDAATGFKGQDLYESDFKHSQGIIVYGFRDDREVLKQIYETITNNKASLKRLSTLKLSKAFRVLQIAESTEKSILGAQKTIHWERFLRTKFFKKIETARFIYQELLTLQTKGYLSSLDYRKLLIKDFEQDYDKLLLLINKYIAGGLSKFTIDQEHLMKEYLPSMINEFEKFKAKHAYKIPLINCIKSGIDNNSIIEFESLIEYFKEKKIRIQNKHYLFPTRIS